MLNCTAMWNLWAFEKLEANQEFARDENENLVVLLAVVGWCDSTNRGAGGNKDRDRYIKGVGSV